MNNGSTVRILPPKNLIKYDNATCDPIIDMFFLKITLDF